VNQLPKYASLLWLGAAGAACNPNFEFDVPDAGLIAAAGGGQDDAGTYEDCVARCATWGQFCAADWGVCVECNTDADCTGAGKRRCWAEDHRCVACATDTDCATGQHCVSQTGECRTACIYSSSDDSCATDGEWCGDSNVCMSCDRDVECVTSNRGKRCLPGCGYCVGCLSDLDCADTGLKCDSVTHTCVACRDGRDCASGCCNIANHSCY
jgi:hypothetical protein